MLHYDLEKSVSLETRYLDTKPKTQTAKPKAFDLSITHFFSREIDKYFGKKL